MKCRTGKVYTQYQVDQLLNRAEKDYEQQWNDKLEEIRETTFESVKMDMFSQFMSVAMATLEMYHGFTKEQSKKFYEDYISLLNLMKSKPLGKEFTPQNCIDNNKEECGLDLDHSNYLQQLD